MQSANRTLGRLCALSQTAATAIPTSKALQAILILVNHLFILIKRINFHVRNVEVQGNPHLPKVARAFCRARLGMRQCRQEQARQDSKDRDDDKKLHESKTTPPM